MANQILKIIPLGGVGQVTKNLFVYELLGRQEEILIVDCGIGFPTEEMPGVDYLFPDVTYLKNKKDKIKGVILSHGHYDHIAGLPYLLEKLGPLPIYASKLTAGFAENILRENGYNIRINVLGQSLNLGSFRITPIPVTHSVPDSRHFLIETPEARVYHGSDFKFDFTPIDGKPSDLGSMAEAAKGGIDLLLTDCVRVEKEGYSLSESSLYESFERELRSCQGRFIFATLSSNINRIQQVVEVIAHFNRRASLIGRSLRRNTQTAERLGYLDLSKGRILSRKKLLSLPRQQQALIVTGSQAETGSTLARIAEDLLPDLKLQAGDKVVFSADPIPGNETAVNLLIDKLTEKGVEVSYKGILDDLHVSGHASSGDLRLLLNLLKGHYLLPIGGTFRQMTRFAQVAQELGYHKEQIFLPREGRELILMGGKMRVGERIFLNQVIVDGRGVGDVGRIILEERRKMAEDGMAVVILIKDKKSGQLRRVKIISRGFVFVRQSEKLLGEAENQVTALARKHLNEKEIKIKITRLLEKLFYKETEREPLILSETIYV